MRIGLLPPQPTAAACAPTSTQLAQQHVQIDEQGSMPSLWQRLTGCPEHAIDRRQCRPGCLPPASLIAVPRPPSCIAAPPPPPIPSPLPHPLPDPPPPTHPLRNGSEGRAGAAGPTLCIVVLWCGPLARPGLRISRFSLARLASCLLPADPGWKPLECLPRTSEPWTHAREPVWPSGVALDWEAVRFFPLGLCSFVFRRCYWTVSVWRCQSSQELCESRGGRPFFFRGALHPQKP